ncbi:hypothetical protein [Roseomonas sp. KE0001]|uniref:hypothetical protein n=1 Tax=Roseomonas sp. KE0001 TaxID=2479201 RepID=UPI0018E062A7|nr:hypothetical protein [Roseomonas sp. KE0001]MBI0435867.1 hypothetical protein [Roseomonas sp. KE0001]
MNAASATGAGYGLLLPFWASKRASSLRQSKLGGFWRCITLWRTALSGPMTMTPERFTECLDLIGWTKRGLARHLGCDAAAVRRLANGHRPIGSDLETWLEVLAAVHAPLSPELREIAASMGCDRGEFVRYPRGVRPITDPEAELLRKVAAAHAAAPLPQRWLHPDGSKLESPE